MQKIITRGLRCLLFAGGITLLGATAAHAADPNGEDGTAPVKLTGNAIAVLDDSMLGRLAVSGTESTESSAPTKRAASGSGQAEASGSSTAESSGSSQAESSGSSQAEASGEGVVQAGPLAVFGASERDAASDPVLTGWDAGEETTGSEGTPAAFTPYDIAVGGSSKAALASSRTLPSTSPTELLLLATALLFAGGTAGLLWRVNRG